MNNIFFFIPFLLVTSIGFYQEVTALETVTGYDYFDIENPDGTHTWITHEPYILDNGVYVPYIQNGLTVNSVIGQVTLNANGSYTWNEKFADRIVGKYADITDLNSWTYPNLLNNDTPDNSFVNDAFHSVKNRAGVGEMDYKYMFKDGKWKTELEVTNLSSLNTKAFGFDQIIDLNSDIIKFGGVVRNLDNFDGVTFDKEFLDSNQGKVLDLLNGVSFDFDLGYENLYSVTIHDTGINSSQLVFDYRTDTILLPGETLIIDPTFSYTVGTHKSPFSIITDCTTNDSFNTNGIVGTDGAANYCYYDSVEWDTSTIPDGSTITDTKIRYDNVLTGAALNCDAKELSTQPSVASSSTIQSEIIAGATYVALTCSSSQTNTVADLGASADSKLQSLLSADWFAIGLIKNPNALGAASYTTFGDVELEVTYSAIPPPASITDLTADSVGSTTASLSFSAPNLNGESLINYMLNVTTPQQATPPSTFWMNGSASPFSVVGLTLGTDYSASASAYTAGGGNWTFANVLNFTTASTNTPDPITDLTGVSDVSLSIITLGWTTPGAGSAPITGYQVNYTTPLGDPDTVIKNDTGNTDVSYEVLNLQIGEPYSFRVAAWNSFGLASGGNIWNGTIETDYQIGNLSSPDVTNTNDFKIFYERTDINSTALFLNVTYPSTYNLECSMYYAFARTNNTYGNLSSITVDASNVESSFLFINATGDIITVNCTDLTSGDTSQYILTISQFPFLEQMNNIKNGTYGTYFKIGAIDGITLVVIFVSMIGLNRTTPIAGIMFVIITTLALSYFDIITYPIIMYPALALMAVWAFMSTRKDD